MLTQLNTVKSRLALTVTDYDDLLTSAIKAVSDRFDKECNRNLARTTAATHEFDAASASSPSRPLSTSKKHLAQVLLSPSVGNRKRRQFFSSCESNAPDTFAHKPLCLGGRKHRHALAIGR